jgi:mannose-1-phosphate guanylyltransferase
MRALILAAGLGTRLRPLTLSVPKCLVSIGGRPLLDYWLSALFAGGIEKVLINTGYLAECIIAHVASSPWRDRIDLVHEPELLGTGGTVLANQSYFRGQPFLVIHGDNLSDCDISGLIAAHHRRPANCVITMLAFRTDQPRLCGILECDDAGLVRAFHEKATEPPGNLANGAVYVFEPEVTAFLRGLDRPVIDLSTEVIPSFIGRIFAVMHAGYHRDIGNLPSLVAARMDMVQGRVAVAPLPPLPLPWLAAGDISRTQKSPPSRAPVAPPLT